MKYRIKNKKTGETKVIDESKLSDFGLSPQTTLASTPTQTKTQTPYKRYEPPKPPKSEFETEGVSYPLQKAAELQKWLGESEALPAGGSILGSILGGATTGHPSLGAGAGAGIGEWQKGWLKGGGIKEAVPTGEEMGDIGMKASGATLVDWLIPQLLKGVGGTLKKVGGPAVDKVGKFLKPAAETLKRQSSAQALRPAAGQLSKELTEEGVSETLEQMSKRGVKGTAKELFVKSKAAKTKIWSAIGKFFKQHVDDLPPVQMEDVAKSLNDDIIHYKRIGEQASVDGLKEMKKQVTGKKTFKEAYELIKSWSREARNYYTSDKAAIDIKPYKARAYKMMADKGRGILKEITADNFPQWVTMMDDYHFWSDLHKFSKTGTAKGQTAIGSVWEVFRRAIPYITSKAQQGAEWAGGQAKQAVSSGGVTDVAKWMGLAGYGEATKDVQ